MTSVPSAVRLLQRASARLGAVRVHGAAFVPPSFDRRLALWLFKSGLMGVRETAFFSSEIRPGMTVLDIGANQGVFTALFSRLAGPSGSVVSFEPDPTLFSALAANQRSNGWENVELHQAALGEAPGRSILYRSLLNGGDNRMSGSAGGLREAVTVEVTTLDRVMLGKAVHFVKMDVQGWEPLILRGMQGVMEANPAMRIFFEYWPHGMRSAGLDPREPFTLLQNRGFELHVQQADRWRAVRDPSDLAPVTRGKRFVNLLAFRG